MQKNDEGPRDPRTTGRRPPMPAQSQPSDRPGREYQMNPLPDWGRDSYVGHGRLRGRAALVTGGDSGIGRAVALAFAREGADVVIAYREEHEDAATVRDAVEAADRRAVLLPGDLADPAFCERTVDETVRLLGRIDVVVNNAAWQGPAVDSLDAFTDERLLHTFRVNILAMFHVVRRALPHLRPGASVINTASIEAYQPHPGILDYAATKGAIVTFTKGLAKLLGERGVRANVVAPGEVWTPLIPQSFGADDMKEEGTAAPLGRAAQPVDLAPAFVFLASDESRFVNGEVLGVTGGVLLP